MGLCGKIPKCNSSISNHPVKSSFMLQKRKILVTGGKWMLAYDFFRSQREKYEIVLTDKEECDITSFESLLQCIHAPSPDVLLNCAAYTAVDDAEDVGMKMNYDVNTLWVYSLAKASGACGIDFITISTDYVFDGENPHGYKPTDVCNPLNAYGMAKYLGEKLALDVNPRTIVIRTSWLYGGEIYGIPSHHTDDASSPYDARFFPQWGVYKNFMNTMLRLSETHERVKVVDDQHGRSTSCLDLSKYISTHIDAGNDSPWGIYHFSSPRKEFAITWADFAEEIFMKYGKTTQVIRCHSEAYPAKAKRPKWSILLSDS